MPSIKGTASVSDSRALDKALKSTKFPPHLSEPVDISKLNRPVFAQYIEKQVLKILGFEDEIVESTIINLFLPESTADGGSTDSVVVDPKRAQIDISGFLGEEKTPQFVSELWELMLDAMKQPQGIPRKFIEEKKAELALANNYRPPNNNQHRPPPRNNQQHLPRGGDDRHRARNHHNRPPPPNYRRPLDNRGRHTRAVSPGHDGGPPPRDGGPPSREGDRRYDDRYDRRRSPDTDEYGRRRDDRHQMDQNRRNGDTAHRGGDDEYQRGIRQDDNYRRGRPEDRGFRPYDDDRHRDDRRYPRRSRSRSRSRSSSYSSSSSSGSDDDSSRVSR